MTTQKTFKILEDAKPGKGNAGLWWNKYFNQWEFGLGAAEFKLDEKKKNNWLTEFVGLRHEGVDALQLEQFAQRVSQMVKASQGMVMHFQSTERLTLGLGYEHPMENGFTFHHTLGLPYIPASSVKGLVYAWARYWCEANPTDLTRIFGSEISAKDPSQRLMKQVGSVRFFDALPVKPITFEADVMTPHYGPWYSDGEPPADWHNPVPIGFLTAKAGATFQFALAPRQTQDAADMQQYVHDMQQCAQWLTDALLGLGVGAKTAVGYGRMTRLPDPEEERAKQVAKKLEEEANNVKYLIGKLTWPSMKISNQQFGYVVDQMLKLPEAQQELLINELRNHPHKLLTHPDVKEHRRRNSKIDELLKKFNL